MNVDAWLGTVEERLYKRRFTRLASPGDAVDRAYHRREFDPAKLSMVDTMVALRVLEEPPDVKAFKAYSHSVFKLSKKHKYWLPAGFGSAVVAHPVLVAPSVTPELAKAVKRYSPAHLAAFEFPAIVAMDEGRIHLLGSAPAWGWAYYKGLRKTLLDILGAPERARREPTEEVPKGPEGVDGEDGADEEAG